MNHALKVIVGFTFMIAVGLGVLYYVDQAGASKNGLNPVNAGAGCAAKGDC